MNISIKYNLSLCILVCLFNSQSAFSFDPWVVNDFRVEGAQRISEGTILALFLFFNGKYDVFFKPNGLIT